MRDNEYSRPDKEFFPTGQEISGPGREWNAPPQEWSGVPREADYSGREYHQDSTLVRRERKKKRRLQPAMLAAAAVVTAVIAFAPAESPQHPTQELSANLRTYLEAVWTTMKASNPDELEVLPKDDMAWDSEAPTSDSGDTDDAAKENEPSVFGHIANFTIYTYNENGDMLKQEDYTQMRNIESLDIYDVDGNLLKHEDYAEGEEFELLDSFTEWEYDGSGNVIKESHFRDYGSTGSTHTYDGNQDRAWITMTHTQDIRSNGWIEWEYANEPAGGDDYTVYESVKEMHYQSDGSISRDSSASFEQIYSERIIPSGADSYYDSQGRLTKYDYPSSTVETAEKQLKNGSFSRNVRYYDESGRLLREEVRDIISSYNDGNTYYYTYDALGRLERKFDYTYKLHGWWTFEYDEKDLLIRETYYWLNNGVKMPSSDYHGYPWYSSWEVDENSANKQKWTEWEYDGNGNKIKESQWYVNYNGEDTLSQWTEWEYDAVGNLTKDLTAYGSVDNVMSLKGFEGGVYDENGTLRSQTIYHGTEGYLYEYDENGNVTLDEKREYTYEYSQEGYIVSKIVCIPEYHRYTGYKYEYDEKGLMVKEIEYQMIYIYE